MVIIERKKIFLEYLFLKIKNKIIVTKRKIMGIIEFLNRIASELKLIPALSTLVKIVGSFMTGNDINKIKIVTIRKRVINVFLKTLKISSFFP